MEYKEFVDLKEELKAGSNNRLKVIFEANASYCIKKLVSKYRCSQEDAEDIYVDSVLNFRDKMLEGKIEFLTDVRSYLYATCRNMWLARMQQAKRIDRAVNEMHTDYHDVDHHSDTTDFRDELVRVTREGLSRLADGCWELLKLFYFDKLALDEIADKLGFANANVAKVSKSRCFQKLVYEIKIIQEKKVKGDVVK